MIPAEGVGTAEGVETTRHPDTTGWREKGIEYLSPEYWAYLQDGAGKH